MMTKDNNTQFNSLIKSDHYAVLTEPNLRNIIPAHSKLLDKRIQPSLDFFSREFISHACVVILATSSNNIAMTPLIYQSNLTINNDKEIEINNLLFDATKTDSINNDRKNNDRINNYSINNDSIINDSIINDSQHYCNASLFVIVPNISHSLRINGELKTINKNLSIFNIQGIYFHCARASARSDFWNTLYQDAYQKKITEYNIISLSPYALLKTQNTIGKTEISPRGDEAGFIKLLSDGTLFMPERPGNNVAVSLRNIIEYSGVELLFMVPGSAYTLNVTGQAYITTQPELLDMCQVNKKRPKVGIVIKIESKQFQFDANLYRSGLWDENKAVDKHNLTAFPKALSSHINGVGLVGKATTAVIGAIVKHDMKNLY
jgi:predicted pyridoxine 5'-phosphate oxidase superfamily flavin-nucleotide-binding protein